MTTQAYIDENKTELFKKGDKVVMHTCHESTLPIYKDKVWTCLTDSFLARDKSEVVFLENFSGYFSAEFLKKLKKSAHQVWQEAKDLNLNDQDFKAYLKKEGVIASKESIDRQHEIAENILKKFKKVNIMNTENINVQENWDKRLVEAFGDLINPDGWLTSDWHEFLESNFKDWDENGNETNKKKELYGLMYNLDFEESQDSKFIRPISQHNFNQKSKRNFIKDEKINHKKYGVGTVKEVFDFRIEIVFDSGKQLKFVTYLFEEQLL